MIACRKRNAEIIRIDFSLLVLRPRRSSRESHHECTRNSLKRCSFSNKWWETLKVSTSGVFSCNGSGGRLVVIPAEKHHLWVHRLTERSVLRSLRLICHVSLSRGVVLGILDSCSSASAFWAWHLLYLIWVLILWEHFFYFWRWLLILLLHNWG